MPEVAVAAYTDAAGAHILVTPTTPMPASMTSSVNSDLAATGTSAEPAEA